MTKANQPFFYVIVGGFLMTLFGIFGGNSMSQSVNWISLGLLISELGGLFLLLGNGTFANSHLPIAFLSDALPQGDQSESRF